MQIKYSHDEVPRTRIDVYEMCADGLYDQRNSFTESEKAQQMLNILKIRLQSLNDHWRRRVYLFNKGWEK